MTILSVSDTSVTFCQLCQFGNSRSYEVLSGFVSESGERDRNVNIVKKVKNRQESRVSMGFYRGGEERRTEDNGVER